MIRSVLAILSLAALVGAAPATAETPARLPGLAPEAGSLARLPPLQSWMQPEIGEAWRAGFTGRGTTITIVDDFKSRDRYFGNLGTGQRARRHGEWVRDHAGMIAPGARLRSHDFGARKAVPLRSGLNVINLSYGMMAVAGHDLAAIGWWPRERSIVAYAEQGRAVISKAAGNDSVAVGQPAPDGYQDYLNLALIGTPSAVFVGALSRHGTPTSRAPLAGYSNFAGPDPAVQQRFLVVGVQGNLTGLYGTSFAAPVVSGYAAVLGSKFRGATPAQITDRLLETARRDTVLGYNPALHGQGEASIARALAPVSIE